MFELVSNAVSEELVLIISFGNFNGNIVRMFWKFPNAAGQ